MEEEKVNEVQRSEEVRDIIDRMPTNWSTMVAVIVGVLMGIVLLLGFVIKYPDTVDGQISITATKAPVRLISRASGRIHLLIENNREVKVHSVIAYIESGVDYGDVLDLDTLLNGELSEDTELVLPTQPKLGELGSAYNAFALSYKEYDRIRRSDLYSTMRRTLKNQMQADVNVTENIEKELVIKKEIVDNSREQLGKDSALLASGGISLASYKSQHTSHLAQEESKINLESTRFIKISDISRNQIEMARVNIEEEENLQKAYMNLLANKNTLRNAITMWKERYLLVSTIGGTLEYLGFWRDNTYVAAEQELFSILPSKNDVVGEVYIPSLGAGKIKIGQEANVKLNDFPYDEYGLLKGVVASISKLTNKLATKNGALDTYLVTVKFKHGLTTNFNKTLPVNFESKGTIEIITKPKRLIERLFDNLKAKSVK